MRITNAQITATMHNSMNGNSAQLGKIMQQLATNKRLLLPSDDPIASIRVMRVQREEASLAQYRKNIDNVSGSLSTQEATWALLAANASDDAILNAMIADPILVERPIVETPKGARIGRPVERVLGEQHVHAAFHSFIG